jgi:LPS export ABC transporter protein LptC
MNKNNLLFTIILIIAFTGISLLALMQAKKIVAVHTNAIDAPDFFMTNADFMQFDVNGNLSNHFYTSKITHFGDQNSYIFDSPTMQMYNANEQPWLITAQKGKSEKGKSKIYLWGNVQLKQGNGDKNNFSISTTSLIVYPDTKSAETPDPVTIIQGTSIAKTIGAKANFKSGTVELLSNVNCEYQTQAK